MYKEIILAVIQGITEFLPISSSGHLALISNLISEPNLFFMIAMHLASLIAILIYFRKDIVKLSHLKDKKNYHYYKIILLGIIPAVVFGYFFSDLINKAINSYIFIGTGFLVSTLFLLSSKLKIGKKKNITLKDSIIIGFAQVLTLFPGVSRSGTTTSTGMLRKVSPEEAGRFSFLMFIPLMIGAAIFEFQNFYINSALIVSFIVCFGVSMLSLSLFFKILKKGYFWIFGIWTLIMGLVSLSFGIGVF